MRLLSKLTLLYTAVLVLVLAGSLVAIWVYLDRIRKVVGEVRAALERVQDQTQPLEGPLQRLQELAAEAADQLAVASEALERANNRLGAVAEQAGVGQPTR